MMTAHLTAVTIGFFLDLLIGDPPNWPHPVRWIGTFIAFLDKSFNKGSRRRLKGMGMVVAVLAIVMVLTGLSMAVFYWLHPAAGIVWEGLIIYTTVAQKSLKEAALEVYQPLQKSDLQTAREKLSYIVGRDTDWLEEPDIVRGTVETVAENTSDGVTAPLFWGLIGGAVLAAAYRAINTCDSMVGYRNDRYEEFGWASARLDDLVNWLPSRLTGLLMVLSMKPEKTGYITCWKILFRDAKKHPSPNSGWGEAATAAILGVQLGGINYYKGIVSNRAKMGDPIVPLQPLHILKTIALMKRTAWLFLLLLWMGGLAIDVAATRF